MKRKSFFSLSLLSLLTFFAQAQTKPSELDSLHEVLSHAPSDTVRMFTIYGIASYYAESDRDSSLYFCEASIALAEKLEQPIWKANFLLTKSYILQKQFNLALSLSLCNESLRILEDDSNDKRAYIPKGAEFASEPAKYRKAITISVYHQLGNTIKRAGNQQKAIEYYKKEIQVADELGTNEGKMTSNMNIGSIYYQMGQLDSAMIYARKSIRFAEISGYHTYVGIPIMTIGKVYLKEGVLDSARFYLEKALEINKEQKFLAGNIDFNIALADFHEQLNQPDSVYYYAANALKTRYQLNSEGLVNSSAERVAQAWKILGNSDSAYAYLAIAKQLGDSINTLKNEKLIEFQNVSFEQQLRLEKEAQESMEARNKIRTVFLLVGLGFLVVLVFVFYRNNRQKQKANAVLEKAYANLKSTQTQLIHSEKMASLGELTAGIAHEIQNPLNFVNNFSDLNKELLEELKDAVAKNDQEEVTAIIKDLSENETKINHHGKRAEEIVKSMLQHSRTGSGEKELTDINALADECLRLSYHGLRAKDKSFNADFRAELDPDLPKINVIPQDIGRVILNLINNAFYSVKEVEKPEVIVSTKKIPLAPFEKGGVPHLGGRSYDSVGGGFSSIQITVSDNGTGIPDSIKEKIFQPFFTTKPTGQGTGLGLSMSYDIVTKGHGGTLVLNSDQVNGTTFTLTLPVILPK